MNDKPTEQTISDLPVITKFIYSIGVLPTSYKMSMTYEEQVVWLCNYLETTIIPAVNQNGEAVEELQNLYELLRTYVNDYFDNLDVQQEINKKLDEMAEDGSLTALVKKYVDPIQQEFENEIMDTVNNQNILINNMNTKVNASVGINPLPAATTDDMTDTSRIYVLETDGNWYYYDGETWQSGGVYQATSYGENTITSKSIQNIVYDKVNNNLLTKSFTTSNFTNLSGATLSEDTTTITVRRTAVSSNAQFRINFSFDEVQLGQHIILTLTNLRCRPQLNIATSSNKSVNGIFKNGEFIIPLAAEDVKATTTIIFSLYANQFSGIADGEIFMTVNKTYKICNSSFYQYLSSNNLSTLLNNLTKYDGITNRYDYIDITNTFQPATSMLQLIVSGNNYNFTTNNNNGLKTDTIYKTSSTLHIKGNVGALSNNITLYVITYESDNTQHYNSFAFKANDVIDLEIDLAYYAVYQNMDHFVIVITVNNGTAVLNNFVMYIDDLADMEIYDPTLGNTLRNIQNKFSNIESTIAQYSTELTAPNGNKYRLAVNNSGELYTIPVSLTATKALFIGNSLLQGFQTHGMASYSVNDDYYYYVNQELLDRNPNYTSSKISGTAWEAAVNTTEVNNFLSTLSNSMTSDTDTVFIQLGDNCNTADKINFITTKAPMLIEAIRAINPSVAIYWIASWYNNSAKQNNIVNVCNAYSVKFINIAPLAVDANKAYVGYEYIDANGTTQTITNSGVASHPSSVGMKAIADLIIENL